jgi:glycosyltransferase involved in cell wall biosynthesis
VARQAVEKIAYPRQPDDAASWAHSSGWGELNANRRRISCIAHAYNDCVRLTRLLPALSDALTECGYPWELIAIDAGSEDGTGEFLATLSELPGFRSIRLGRGTSKAESVMAGLQASRGDAAVLVDARTGHSPRLIPDMIFRWECGAKVAYAIGNRESGGSDIVSWGNELPGDGRRASERQKSAVPSTEFVLLNRSMIDWLLS